jgi:protein pelota
MQESPYVRMGSYHTLELALQRKFSIAKHEWDSISLERLETACDPRKTADLGAILMQEGLANLCLVTS